MCICFSVWCSACYKKKNKRVANIANKTDIAFPFYDKKIGFFDNSNVIEITLRIVNVLTVNCRIITTLQNGLPIVFYARAQLFSEHRHRSCPDRIPCFGQVGRTGCKKAIFQPFEHKIYRIRSSPAACRKIQTGGFARLLPGYTSDKLSPQTG